MNPARKSSSKSKIHLKQLKKVAWLVNAQSWIRTLKKLLQRKGFRRNLLNGPNTKGEIRWADLNPTRGREQAGKRPVLILSHDVFNERSGTVITVALTSRPQQAGFPLTLPLQSKNLPKTSWVKISQIRTLSVERIGSGIGRASAEEMTRIVEGLNEIIGG